MPPPSVGLTVASRVTGFPTVLGLGDEVTLVLVDAGCGAVTHEPAEVRLLLCSERIAGDDPARLVGVVT